MKKKILIIAAVVVLALSVSAVALADTSGTRDIENGKALGLEKQEQRETAGRLIYRLFNKYYPEGLETLLETREAHREFHEEAREDREELAQAIREAREEIKEALEKGDIDRVEARRLFGQLKSDVEAMKSEFAEVRDEKRAAQEPIRERLAEIRSELKVLLGEDPVDGDSVKALLEESLGLFIQHLDNDIYYHGIFLGIAESYGF